MAVSIEQIEGSGGSKIGDFVSKSPSAILYYSPHYISLISKHLNASCGWLVASDGDDIKRGPSICIQRWGSWASLEFHAVLRK